MMFSLFSRRHAAPRAFFFASAFLASGLIALTSGCASGGFKLTRQYASFVNRQNIVVRILLYIFTSIVFAATLLIDFVINNTIDFWNGRVAAGTYNFKSGDKTFVARHEMQPGSNLKRSTIEVRDLKGDLLQTVLLQETNKNEIEVFIDGVLRTRVRDIHDAPVASLYDTNGSPIANDLPITASLATN